MAKSANKAKGSSKKLQNKSKTSTREQTTSNKSKVKSDVEITEGLDVKPPEIAEKNIIIKIESIKNVSSSVKEILIHVDDNSNFKYESPHADVLEDDETQLDWQITFPCFPSDPDWVDQVSANPLVFILLEKMPVQVKEPKHKASKEKNVKKKLKDGKGQVKEQKSVGAKMKASDVSTKNSSGDSKAKGSKRSVNKESKHSKSAKESSINMNESMHGLKIDERVIGNCTFDLLPFLMGETTIRQVLLFEQDEEAYGREIITWPNLPRLTICAKIDELLLPANEVEESNILFVTLESMYNPPAYMTNDLSYQAGTNIPVHFEKSRDVMFKMGMWTEQQDLNKMKHWSNYTNIPGRGGYSTYHIDDDVKSLKNQLDVDVTKKLKEESPRIQWNALRRCWLSKSEADSIQSFITRYRWWPLEILIGDKQQEESVHEDASEDDYCLHLAVFFDVSALLYPGVTKVRVVGQVYTYCQEDMMGRSGFPRSLFFLPSGGLHATHFTESEGSPENQKGSKNLDKKKSDKSSGSGKKKPKEKTGEKPADKKKSKSNEEEKPSKGSKSKKASKTDPKSKSKVDVESKQDSKSKASKKGKKGKSDNSQSKLQVPAPSEDTVPPRGMDQDLESMEYSSPVYTKDGQPVFVIFEIELLKPFRQKKNLDEIVQRVDEIIPSDRRKPPPLVMSPALAEEHFKECIQMISGNISEEYKKFVDKFCKSDEKPDEDFQYLFYKSLQDNGLYHSIKQTLHDKVTTLVREKMRYGFNYTLKNDKQKFISDVYVYVVEQVHIILNKLIGMEFVNPVGCLSNDYELYFFAKESVEEGRFEDAERSFEIILDRNKEDPTWWLEYAVYSIGRQEFDKASQLILEALSLDRRHKLGLLLYALVMSEIGEEKSAFVFFDALTSLYPRFSEGWVIFHLFNLKMSSHDAAEATLQYSRLCTDMTRDKITGPVIEMEPLIWDTKTLPPQDSLFLETAVLLMKLNLTYYAEMALSLEYKYNKMSLSYVYYLSVNHYLEQRYEDALSHLEEAMKGFLNEFSLLALTGHCYHKLGDQNLIAERYGFIVDSGETAPGIHLIYHRMAELKLKMREYRSAKLLALSSCHQHPTSRNWLVVAIASYMLNEFYESEKALVEANLLNNSCPTVWAYLTLVNLQFHRQREFEQCYQQALLNNLQDEELIRCIGALRDSLKYHDPVACTAALA